MRICLVNPRSSSSSESSIPHGLLQLCAEVKRSGHECAIADFTNPACDIRIESLSAYDVIGISIMTTQLKHALEIAGHVKSAARIVWGGVHCLLDPKSVLDRFPDHFVVQGDGEQPFLRILEFFDANRTLDALKQERGVCFTDRNVQVKNPPWFAQDLNTLADIDYRDLAHLKLYLKRSVPYLRKPTSINLLSILTSRGCTWDCAFCINSIYRRHHALHRSKSIAKIRRETDQIIDEYKIAVVIPADEDFFANRFLVKDWQTYAREKHFLWGANCRYNYIPRILSCEDLDALIASGLLYIGMSIETGDETIRNSIINKHVSNADIFGAVQEILKCKNQPAINTSFIINFPGDTSNSKHAVLEWMQYLSMRLNILFSGPQPYRSYPGSLLAERSEQAKQLSFREYIDQTTTSGERRSSTLKQCENAFYSIAAKRFFNSRFRPFLLENSTTGSLLRPGLIIENKNATSLQNAFLSILLASTIVRIRRRFWRFFLEPYLIGALLICLICLRRCLQNIVQLLFNSKQS